MIICLCYYIESDNIVPIVGGVVGGVLLVIGVLVVVCFCYQNKNKGKRLRLSRPFLFI